MWHLCGIWCAFNVHHEVIGLHYLSWVNSSVLFMGNCLPTTDVKQCMVGRGSKISCHARSAVPSISEAMICGARDSCLVCSHRIIVVYCGVSRVMALQQN